jgi:hypothetical protein
VIARVLPVFVACACGAAVPPVPSKGGPTWYELESEHFTLWTDSSLERGRGLIREMEDLRQVVIGVGFRGASGVGRSFVIALRDDDEVAAFMPGDFAAMASPAMSYIRQPMILLAAKSTRDPDHVVAAHELTHTISQAVIKKQPRWFAEGLAKYFETIEIDRRRGTADLGREPTHRGQRFVINKLMSLAQMFKCDDLTCVDGHFYASAWALFTYLTNARSEDLVEYERKLIELEDPPRAWREVFGARPAAELEMDMKHWLVSGSHRVLHFTVQFQQWAVAERKLSDADVHAVRAVMRLQFQELRDDAKKEVAAAVALDATNVLAHTVGFVLENKIAVATARAVTKAHPNDWRAWWLLGAALPHESDEFKQAVITACGLMAKNPAISPPWPCPTSL